uniref:Uncharacterized protein n=1 Tax=Theropithecus gelada TaxID=9565 RepID=A0A8D2FWN8_THEGE
MAAAITSKDTELSPAQQRKSLEGREKFRKPRLPLRVPGHGGVRGQWLRPGSLSRRWLRNGEGAVPGCGSETEVKVEVPEYLGPLLFVKLRKRHLLQDDAWFCNWISVQGPGAGDEVRFPCYRWVEGDGVLSLPEGTGERGAGSVRRWGNWKDGLILSVAGTKLSDLPVDERFLEDKRVDFEVSLAKGGIESSSMGRPETWVPLVGWSQGAWLVGLEGPRAQIPQLAKQLPSPERVRDSWKEDALFGYQFLNGANPMVLRRSAHLPARLVFPPGAEELQAQLEKELEGGTLFEADFSLLDGIKANIILCSQQYLAAPLVMLKLQPDGKLLPMVIQLQLPSTGSPPSPLFLPTDLPMVWLLAKCWVLSSGFQLHELQSHLLRGCLMAEVIAVATMRCLPSIHPIFKVTPYPLLSCIQLNT